MGSMGVRASDRVRGLRYADIMHTQFRIQITHRGVARLFCSASVCVCGHDKLK